MSLAGVAKETIAILERGTYRAPSGTTVDLRAQISAATRGTVLYRPEDLADVPPAPPDDGALAPPSSSSTRVEVTGETTGAAARRLVEREGVARVVALNFASAKNPGGGFLGGAKAQEEDLARCSALYGCLLTQRRYYDANRACDSLLYTDHAIYAPDVPFFRDERFDLLEAPFVVSVITAPAPNAGEVLRKEGGRARDRIRATLRARAGRVLAIAAAHGHRCVVLGAWGCGVFRNDPREVADAFARWLASERFASAFERVVFPVPDRSRDGATRRAFDERFAASA